VMSYLGQIGDGCAAVCHAVPSTRHCAPASTAAWGASVTCKDPVLLQPIRAATSSTSIPANSAKFAFDMTMPSR
jgi:hypothetical protein